MGFTLNVHFEFVCAFVPERPFVGPDRLPTSALVALPDATEGIEHSPNPKESVDPHFAVLRYESSDRLVTSDPQRADDTDFDDIKPPRSPYKIFKLDKEDVFIRPNGKPALGPLRPFTQVNDPDDPNQTTGLEERDLFHLLRIVDGTRLPDGNPLPANQDLEMFNESLKTGSPDELLARVWLEEGYLEVEPRFSAIDYELRRSESTGGALLRPIPSVGRRIRLSLNVDFVDFVFKKFGDPDERLLRIQPSRASEATVTICNCERESIFDRDLPTAGQSPHEFQLYFPLSAAFDGRHEPLQLLRAQGTRDGVCAPAAFNGSTSKAVNKS